MKTGTYLEGNNDGEEEEALAQKVAVLKYISIAIADEVCDQNNFLSALDEQMSAGRGLLSTAAAHFKTMARNNSACKLWLYVLAFAAFVFFVGIKCVRFEK